MKVYKVDWSIAGDFAFGSISSASSPILLRDSQIFSTKDKAEEYVKHLNDCAIQLKIVTRLNTNIQELEVQ